MSLFFIRLYQQQQKKAKNRFFTQCNAMHCHVCPLLTFEKGIDQRFLMFLKMPSMRILSCNSHTLLLWIMATVLKHVLKMFKLARLHNSLAKFECFLLLLRDNFKLNGPVARRITSLTLMLLRNLTEGLFGGWLRVNLTANHSSICLRSAIYRQLILGRIIFLYRLILQIMICD